ncbi:periodic tryptophan protein 1 homolog [Anabrus simplex]|uniref:periodic tryptophan protein 1 homolog n=1 Tax=Anabrus simplex TaxID=316456 RepID=UPI0035A3004A
MSDVPAASINFVPCVKWVRKGVAKSNPEKVQLTEQELEEIIKQNKSELDEVVDEEELEAIKKGINRSTEDDIEDEEVETEEESEVNLKSKQKNVEVDDEFNFAQYDDESGNPDALMGLGNLAVFASTSKDPYVTVPDDSDSENEDDVISPNDNLIVVGHVEDDASILEVYVYNEEEGSLYVHHDLLLPAFPLCLEWLNYDPAEKTPGNLCAVGSMSPIIEVWDLDVVNCLEPVFKLGNKPKKKAGIKRHGHRDAVLDLCWNANFPHILASGSVDQTVLLWDLDTCKASTKLSVFSDKVQTVEWHPFEGQTLLTGSCDSLARVFDCRAADTFKAWQVEGEIERVVWNHFDPFFFLVSTSIGGVHYIDCRSDKPVWQLSAHTKEVTGLALSSCCPGLLITSSNEGELKTWDIMGEGSNSPVFISEKNMGIGAVQCLGACPDLPFIICAGGDKKSNNFEVWDLYHQDAAVNRRFGTRKLLRPVKCEASGEQESNAVQSEVPVEEEEEEEEFMDTASAAMQSLSLEHNSIHKSTKSFQSGSSKKKKKHRGKKFRK